MANLSGSKPVIPVVVETIVQLYSLPLLKLTALAGELNVGSSETTLMVNLLPLVAAMLKLPVMLIWSKALPAEPVASFTSH